MSEYVILLSDEAQENEALAATELQQILQSATGALLSVVYEGEYGITDDTPLISIGNTALARVRRCEAARRAGALGIHHKNSRRAAIHYGGRECARVCVRGV